MPVNPYEVSEQQLVSILDAYADGGATGVLTGIYLPHACPAAEQCDVAPVERVVRLAKEREMAVSIQLLGVPDWMRTTPVEGDAHGRAWTLPQDDETRDRFARLVARFARDHAGEVARYEVWNEPNTDEFTGADPSPHRFAALFLTVRQHLRAADPATTIATGGVSRGDVGFVSQLLDACGDDPPDEIGVHPYAPGVPPTRRTPDMVREGRWGPVDESGLGWRAVVAELDQRHLEKTKVWLGEFGYSSSATWMPAVPDDVRAAYAVAWWLDVDSSDRVAGVAWFAGAARAQERSPWDTMWVDDSGTVHSSWTWSVLSRLAQGDRAVEMAPESSCVSATGALSLPCAWVDALASASEWRVLRADGSIGRGAGPSVQVGPAPWRAYVMAPGGEVRAVVWAGR